MHLQGLERTPIGMRIEREENEYRIPSSTSEKVLYTGIREIREMWINSDVRLLGAIREC